MLKILQPLDERVLVVLSMATVSFVINPSYPNFEFFHENLRFGVFLSVDNYFTFKNSKKYALMIQGPKY